MHPNADAGSEQLLARLKAYVKQHPKTSWAVASLGQKRYLEALQLFEAMAGNSSSGVIEAPLLGMPVLNIGDRQSGRIRSKYVLDVKGDVKLIADGLIKVLEAGKHGRWPRIKPENASKPSNKIIATLLEIFKK